MKNKFGLLLVLVSAASSAFVTADELEANSLVQKQTEQNPLKNHISQAITRFEQTPLEDWSYLISRYENEEGDISSSTEQFMPNSAGNKQWSLLKINGNQPTEKQIQKFVDNKSNKDNNGIALKLRELIQLDSLQLLSESDKLLQATFNVHLSKLGDKASRQLQGTLTFNKTLQFIEQLEIVNLAPFSPVFSAKIIDFKLTLSFFKIDDAILPHQQILTMKGSFAFFTEIDEVSTDTYSNYQYLGQAASLQ